MGFSRQEYWSGLPFPSPGEASKVVWYPISWRIFHSLLWSTQSKSLAQSTKQRYMFFWNSLAFSMLQWMLAIWSLIPLPFLNLACTSGISAFTYCCSLHWRVLSMILLAWTSPDGQYQNQIDYILCSQRWRSSIQSVKARQGPDCGPDHELLISKFRLELDTSIISFKYIYQLLCILSWIKIFF